MRRQKRKVEKKSIMQVAINGNIYVQAQAYAQQKGLTLSSLIEDYLQRIIQRDHTVSEETVPDVVASLIGVAKPDYNDLNGRQAYSRYLEEKYQ